MISNDKRLTDLGTIPELIKGETFKLRSVVGPRRPLKPPQLLYRLRIASHHSLFRWEFPHFHTASGPRLQLIKKKSQVRSNYKNNTTRSNQVA